MDDVLATRATLRRSGWTDRQLAAAVQEGLLIRARKGHYASPQLDAATRAAVAEGGWLSCASALRSWGVWVHEAVPRLHVRMPPGPQRGRRGTALRRHWAATIDPPVAGRVGVVDALRDAFSCLSPMAAVAAVDSCLSKGLLFKSDLDRLAAEIGRARRRWMRLADGRAESGLETIARLRLGLVGIPCRPQVRFEGVGRVDLLVADSLVVEADGDAYHLGRGERQRDRRRDAVLAGQGVPVLRFGSEQLLSAEPWFELAVVGGLAGLSGVKNRGRIVQQARKRLEAVSLTTLLHGG